MIYSLISITSPLSSKYGIGVNGSGKDPLGPPIFGSINIPPMEPVALKV